MRPDIGTVWAADGWRLEWDISEMPHTIDVYGDQGCANNTISGDCSQPYLDQEIARFLRAHGLQQMVMEW